MNEGGTKLLLIPYASVVLWLGLPDGQSRHDRKVWIVGGHVSQCQGLHHSSGERIVGEKTVESGKALSDSEMSKRDRFYLHVKGGNSLRCDLVMRELRHESRLFFRFFDRSP